MKKALVLFEDEGFVNLLPLVFWRSVFELRVGRRLILDRTAQHAGMPLSGVWTRDWIATVAAQRCGAPANQAPRAGTILVNGRWLIDDDAKFPKGPCVGVIESDIAYVVCDSTLAETLRAPDLLDPARHAEALGDVPRREATGRFLKYPWDLIADLPARLAADWHAGDASMETELDKRVSITGKESVHIGERTRVHPTAIINAADGPVYISEDVEIGPYAVIDGPAYIGNGCAVRPHAWLHGGNALGPVCKVGGEVTGCILHSYVNKQHAGFLGHSLVGSWVNLGAGTCNSNLKNTYGRIRSPLNGVRMDTGMQFLGAIIGDHVKLGINSSIPTGAVIGLAAAAASGRFLPKYIPSFGWVTDDGYKPGDPLRLLDVACAAMARRNIDMTDDEVELMLELGTRVKLYEAPGER